MPPIRELIPPRAAPTPGNASRKLAIYELPFFFLPFLYPLPATFSAIATACFCGFPAAISVLMFCPTVLLLDPFLSGIFFRPLIRVEYLLVQLPHDAQDHVLQVRAVRVAHPGTRHRKHLETVPRLVPNSHI